MGLVYLRHVNSKLPYTLINLDDRDPSLFNYNYFDLSGQEM